MELSVMALISIGLLVIAVVFMVLASKEMRRAERALQRVDRAVESQVVLGYLYLEGAHGALRLPYYVGEGASLLQDIDGLQKIGIECHFDRAMK